MNNQQIALKLMSVPGLGPRRILNIWRNFKEIDQVFHASIEEICSVPGIDARIARCIKSSDNKDFIESQLEILSKSPFQMTTLFDQSYPAQLKNIYDPPVILYHHGDFTDRDHDAVAIVGTRKPTSYGKSLTEELVKGLVGQGVTIVSGFARGIDSTAHKSALLNGGRTIAVLGNGIDRIYPPENRELRSQIVENGVYCSEFPFGTKPDATNFPRRNRIISGLSLGVVVIEAGQKSGAILTAYYANDQSREVFALPGRVDDLKSQGTNQLIQKGAKLITDVDDILEEIDRIRKFPVTARQLHIEFKLAGEEKAIYDILSNEPIDIDSLAEKLKKSPYEVLPTLLTLELKGHVRQLAGKMFIRVT
jgi:DNA processing protein